MALAMRVTSYRRDLNSYLADEKVKAIVKECSSKILFNRGSADIPAIIKEMRTRADTNIHVAVITAEQDHL
ncbi:hypothetical protein, partial [Klebsiella pneumoniae]|uniref:hypothetical protein n=1 Tax=Klebsiella pneumoniae TaxID=573 RepID=UPI00396AADDB